MFYASRCWIEGAAFIRWIGPLTQHSTTANSHYRIVILNWNEPAETLACVASLLRAGAAPETLIVVDNGSTDGSVAILQDALPQDSHFLSNECNLGFAAGINRGIQAALAAPDVTWVLLQNNDTRVAEDFLARLLWTAIESPWAHAYQILAPVIFYAEAPDIVWSTGERRLAGTLLTYNRLRNRPLPDTLVQDKPIPADFVNACSILVHREVFEAIGLFDPTFFMYGEDNEFCWRATQAGFRIAWVPKARVWHRVGWSSRHQLASSQYWRTWGQVRFYRQAARGWERPFLFGITLARTLAHSFRSIWRGKRGPAIASLRGWWEGWFGSRTSGQSLQRCGGQVSSP